MRQIRNSNDINKRDKIPDMTMCDNKLCPIRSATGMELCRINIRPIKIATNGSYNINSKALGTYEEFEAENKA